MVPETAKRLGRWSLFAGGCIAASSTQTLQFEISFFLRQRGLLGSSMTLLGFAALLVVADRLVFKVGNRRQFGLPFIIGIAGLIFEATVISGPSEAMHIFIYFGLTALAFRALTLDLRVWRAVIVSAALTSLYGFIDELVQEWNPVRRFDWNDVFLNIRIAVFSALGVLGLGLAHPSSLPIVRPDVDASDEPPVEEPLESVSTSEDEVS